jgi:hypothetical protein
MAKELWILFISRWLFRAGIDFQEGFLDVAVHLSSDTHIGDWVYLLGRMMP